MFVEPAVVPDFDQRIVCTLRGASTVGGGGVSAMSDTERGKESLATKSGQFSATAQARRGSANA